MIGLGRVNPDDNVEEYVNGPHVSNDSVQAETLKVVISGTLE